MTGLARLTARAVLAAGPIPPPVVDSARWHLLDSLGVAVAAAVAGPVRGLTTAGDLTSPGAATVVGRPNPVDAASAALINGALVHSLEYDDTHAASIVHGSSVLTSTALAAAEASGADFAALTRGYVLGWEFAIRFGLAAGVAIQRRGFQVSSVLGPFAAAVTAGVIRGVDEDGLVRSLGVAASQPAGSFAFLESAAYTKSMQPGWAAHSGLLADRLARAGITAAEGSLDGPYALFRLYTDLDPAECESAVQMVRSSIVDIGREWLSPEAAFKLVPCCHYIHPFVDAARAIREQGVSVDKISRIVAHVPTEVIPVIAEPWSGRQKPVTAHEGRWSLPYVLGLAFSTGTVELADFDGTLSQAALAVAGRCELQPWVGSGFPERFPAWLDVELVDGTTLRSEIDDVLGGRTRPASTADVAVKFRRNAILGLRPAEVEELADLILEQTAPDVAAIGRLLRQVRTST